MKRILAVVSLVACATFAFAQGAAKDPVASSLRQLEQRSQNNTIAAVEAMPADKFSYKPTADQMTFAHLAVHIIEFNNSICSKAADVPAPKAEKSNETDSKDKIVAAVKASYAFCSEALAKMDDSKLGEEIDLFGGHKAPRAMAALIAASGWSDHYAAAAQYLRLNGVTPPSAQQKH
ncbi:MAG TPA: DinB family protein [Candidatus Eisenbacteria bacterium]|nr:DinB family protein [Candidatus Eisenbacteria bacterium]